MHNDSLLTLRQLSLTFGSQTVLDSLNLEVKQGEIVALVGASGSGKSSLMNLMMGSIKPTSGEIWLKGKPLADYRHPKQLAQQIGMLHQQLHLVEALPVRDNVLAGRLNQWGFWRSLLSRFIPQDRLLAEQALAAVGLTAKFDSPTAQLSGGEQQRVAIARLLVQNPELILADEPISALDPANAQKVLALLTDLVRQKGKTLIASMHSVEFAQAYFDRMIGLANGKILFDLPAKSVRPEQLNLLYGLASNEVKTDTESGATK